MALVVLHVCLYPLPSPSPITPTNNYTMLCNILRFTFCSAAKECECQMQQNVLQLNKNVPFSHLIKYVSLSLSLYLKNRK